MTTYCDLPVCFCWTRFGTEAGQTIEQILIRKEQERQANKGTFFWGIGNSVGPGIDALVRRCSNPEVLFSPIKGTPRFVDVAPESVVAWTLAETLSGEEYPLPRHSLITSRQNNSSSKRTHYALVCSSDSPLSLPVPTSELSFRNLRNVLSGKPLGVSQITAIVTRDKSDQQAGVVYKVSLRANLAPPYFLRLRNPEAIPVNGDSGKNWAGRVHSVWQERMSSC